MFKILRWAIIVSVPALLYAAWCVSPGLINQTNMRWLGGVFVLVWGPAMLFLTKTADLSNLPGLNGREMERLVLMLADIRRRVLWIGAISLISTVAVWLITAMPDLDKSPAAPLLVGFLVGLGLSYLVILPGWFSEVAAFTDKLRERNEKKKRAELALKQIADGKKLQVGKVVTGQ